MSVFVWGLRLKALLILLFLFAPNRADAAEPVSFSIIPPHSGKAYIELGDELGIQLKGAEGLELSKVRLLLDGFPLEAEPRVVPDRQILYFELAHSPANHHMWSRLLGAPLSEDRTISVPIELVGNGAEFRPQGWVAAGASSPRSAVIQLRRYRSPVLALVAASSVLLVLVGTLVAARTTLLRDSLFPQMRLQDRSFSLGRLQMALWLLIVSCSYIFIFSITGDLNSISDESLALLGISGATALGAVAIDQSKSDPVTLVEKALVAMGIRSGEDVNALYASAPSAPAREIIPGANIPANSKSGLGPDLDPTVGNLREEYEKQLHDYKSDGFWKDILNDVNGPTIHRAQIVIWTVVLASIYITTVYSHLEPPAFGTTLLGLMGLSGGVYLGFKVPEKQKTENS